MKIIFLGDLFEKAVNSFCRTEGCHPIRTIIQQYENQFYSKLLYASFVIFVSMCILLQVICIFINDVTLFLKIY